MAACVAAALAAGVPAYPEPAYPEPTYAEPAYPAKPAYPEPAYPSKAAYPAPAYSKPSYDYVRCSLRFIWFPLIIIFDNWCVSIGTDAIQLRLGRER